MAKQRPPVIEACKQSKSPVVRLDHVELIADDLEWLAVVERLTVWNVKIPRGLLAQLEPLWWLDIRGGSGADLAVASGARNLQYLSVSHVRGMCDLSLVSEMTKLRYLDLYALPKVTELPSCAQLVNLEHAHLGQMRGLRSLHGLLQAPKLRELEFLRKINVSETDVGEIIDHPAIEQFRWCSDGCVPDKVWMPVVEKINLPGVRCQHAETWFRLPGFTEPVVVITGAADQVLRHVVESIAAESTNISDHQIRATAYKALGDEVNAADAERRAAELEAEAAARAASRSRRGRRRTS